MSSELSPSPAGKILTITLGVVIALLGLFLLGGGLYLAILGGSLYYVVMGAGLIASGYFIIRGQLLGAWIFFIFWALTVLWTIYEVQFDWWGWLPRDFGPTIVAVLVAFSIPTLRRRQTRRQIRGGVS